MAANASFTEKGLLQLLMDVRFLHDALAGGRPQDTTSPPAALPGQSSVPAPAVRQREAEYRQLEGQLQVRFILLNAFASASFRVLLAITQESGMQPANTFCPNWCSAHALIIGGRGIGGFSMSQSLTRAAGASCRRTWTP